MYTEFDSLPGSSRVWIYQGDRKLTTTEVELANREAKVFVEEWTSHQLTLQAGFKIFHHIFLVLAVNRSHNDASGCSIDKSVRFIQSLEKMLGVNFFKRLNVVYDNNGEKEIIHSSKLKELVSENKIPGSVKVFNNLVSTKKDLDEKWLVDLKESWVQGI